MPLNDSLYVRDDALCERMRACSVYVLRIYIIYSAISPPTSPSLSLTQPLRGNNNNAVRPGAADKFSVVQASNRDERLAAWRHPSTDEHE